MMDRCDFCGRSHGWTTLVSGATGKLICDQCISLCVLTLERQSIEQRMEGLRNVMQDAIDFENCKIAVATLSSELAAIRNSVTEESDGDAPEPCGKKRLVEDEF